MKRIPEPELMNDAEQALAYASADFEEPHNRYVQIFGEMYPDIEGKKTVLDLGCGPGDITFRFARKYPEFIFHAVDGSAAMLKYGKIALDKSSGNLRNRILFVEGYIPEVGLPQDNYDIILATSFLHQLHDPQALWQTIRKYSRTGTIVFITDLFRPGTIRAAKEIMNKYVGSEPEVLKRDYYNSLLAAFTMREVRSQLKAARLTLDVKAISDRHIIITGII